MCGISGIIFNNDLKKINNLSYVRLNKIILNINSKFKSKKFVENLYDYAWKLKNNQTFLKYFNNVEEKEAVVNICKLLNKFLNQDVKKIRNQKNDKFYGDKIEKIKDILWFVENELIGTSIFISQFLNPYEKKTLDNSVIIFYKNLSIIINSINFLEMRGRDSLGISISLNLDKILNLNINRIKNLVSVNTRGNRTNVLFNFKFSSSIGHLGQNSERLIKQMKDNSAFQKILSVSKIINGSIICHTRWASVGAVNDDNCHPIPNIQSASSKFTYVQAFVNGDIYNYEEILSKESFKSDPNINTRTTSDALSIPYVFSNKRLEFKDSYIRKRLNQLTGSYALALESTSSPEEILISKSGSQGLYIGYSQQDIMFSSDVYGLIENCRYFYSLPSDCYLCLNKKDCNYQIKIRSIKKNRQKTIHKKDYKETLITTRDISKSSYSHYLEKEIYETESILNRSRLSHIDINKLKNKRLDFFNNQFKNIDFKIIDKVRQNRFDEIIITGMGTCYTAAVVISRYMRDILRKNNTKIIVQPHIATEGSAFYLKSKMKKTLVIVIAQSGTTIDTNVYVKLAKERGASTLAIINKRDGDVTFLVDSSIYLGNGRDIEIAVPSTKTFNAHIITGYYLTLYLYSKTKKMNKKLLFEEAKKLSISSDIAKKSVKKFKKINLHKTVIDKFLNKKNWYMLYDDTDTSAACQEIRIKLSECCYTSVPYHEISYLEKHKIKDSLIILILGKKDSISNQLIYDLAKTNFIFIISDKLHLNKKNIFTLQPPKTSNSLSFLPTVIFGQLLSYKIAIRMDDRKKYLEELIDKNFNENSKNKLKKSLKEGLFNKGIEKSELKIITSLLKSQNNINSKRNALKIINIIKRPIDTIKHQAKTITVGTQRIQKITNKTNLGKDLIKFNSLNKKKDYFLNYYVSIIRDKTLFQTKDNIFFYSNELDESIVYFAINYLNNISKKFGINIVFHLAREYDLKSISGSKKNIIFNLKYKRNKKFNNLMKTNLQNIYDFDLLDNKITACEEVNQSIEVFNFCNEILLSTSKNPTKDKLSKYLTEMKKSLFSNIYHITEVNIFGNNLKKINEIINMKDNLKFIGSGVNYNISKLASKLFSSKFNISCAYDVLENHKHIDMSAEPLLFVLISNIKNLSYQMDAKSEIEKFISHGNIPIIILNQGDDRFDEMYVTINKKKRKIIKIKIPNVSEDISFIPSLLLIDKITRKK